ncbi:MAG: VanZ family protein [candidate division Zixibacteria bacterium]|nr:VanZ family protein [candidate division Zixibacteria bacterium]
MKRFALYQLPLIIYALIVFYVSSLSRLPDTGLQIPYLDKLAHAAEYFLFGFMAIRVTANLPRPLKTGWVYTLAILLSLVFGLSDEYHQWFVPGRTADPFDLMADALGIFLAAFVYYLLHRRRRTAP